MSFYKIKHADLPSYDAKIIFLKSKLAPLLKKETMVLDAGCGYKNPLLSKEEVRYLIGCDIEFRVLQKNTSASHVILADLNLLPFSEEFDLIVSLDVVEHLENPLAFIQESKLVLKPMGLLFLVLPNKNSLFGMGAALIPLKIKRILYKLLTGNFLKNEVHFYRMNNVARLHRTLEANGFKLIEISMMNYLSSQSWMRFVFFPYYFLCKISIFSRFSPNIFCLAQKQEPPPG
jgi:SAM-dependent methyltransferase